MSTQEQETEGTDARTCLTLRITKDSGIQRGMGGNNLDFDFQRTTLHTENELQTLREKQMAQQEVD